MSSYKFKTTNIKGKEYVEVNERLKYFRLSGQYEGWSLRSEVVALTDDSCVIMASAIDDDGVVRATGLAQEDRTSSHINKTSYVENCETSAWGRCLASLAIGIDTSIASSNEVDMAIKKQALPEQPKLKQLTDSIKGKMIEAVKEGKIEQVKTALNNYKADASTISEILKYAES